MNQIKLIRDVLDRLEQRAEVIKCAIDGLAGVEDLTPRDMRRALDGVADELAPDKWPDPDHWTTADGKAWHLRGVAHHQLSLMVIGCAVDPAIPSQIDSALECALSMLLTEITGLRDVLDRYEATGQ